MLAAPDVCLVTFDVEWACAEVMDDLLTLLSERNLSATFFCTGPEYTLPGHERALHPNFRRSGNSQLNGIDRAGLAAWSDPQFYRYIVESARKFCPEAIGVRSHSLFFDSDVLPSYRATGLRYDSSQMLPFAPGITPVMLGRDIVGLPIYYMDHWDLVHQVSGFTLEGLQLDRPGLKILDFHPTLVYLNATSRQQYLDVKPHYGDATYLKKQRRSGKGVRTLLLDVLDRVAKQSGGHTTLGELSAEISLKTVAP